MWMNRLIAATVNLLDGEELQNGRRIGLTEVLMLVDMQLCSVEVDDDYYEDFTASVVELSSLLFSYRSNVWVNVYNPDLFNPGTLGQRLPSMDRAKLPAFCKARLSTYQSNEPELYAKYLLLVAGDV